MGFARPLAWPIYQGGGVTADVPSLFFVGLNGRGYAIDTVSDDWGEQSIPIQRAQSDQSDAPGEHSFSPEGVWRRSIESWHKGAGQRYLDRSDAHLNDPDSDPGRFYTSVGVDPWTKGQLSLLPACDAKKATLGATNTRLVVCGARLYCMDANTLTYTTDVTAGTPTFTAVTTGGTALSSPVTITADGTNVFVGDSTNLYWSASSGTTYVAAMAAPAPTDVVRYCKGRLMHGNNDVWSEALGTLGAMTLTTVFDHRNAGFQWVDFVGGTSHIYGAGYSGDKSLIYKTTITADATALTAPSVAAELPDGEIVRSLGFYLGFVFIGTDNGVRLAAPDTNGNLDIGDLIDIGVAVSCFEGQDRFVWFGWTNYDATHTGLGRMDLRSLNGTTPAYATDLMSPNAQGTILSVVTFQGVRAFTNITALGGAVDAQDTSKVTSGTVTSGLIGFGITEPKTALYLDSRHASGAGSYQASLSVDQAAFATVGGTVTTLAAGGNRYSTTVSQQAGEQFEITYTLTRDASDATSGPVLNRWTLKVIPQPPRNARIGLPLLLHRTLEVNGQHRTMDVAFEKAVLTSLWQSGRVVSLLRGMTSTSVVLDDYRWVPIRQVREPDWAEEGTFLAILKEV